MKSFSQRLGLKPVKSIIQKDSVDDELRNQLWNLLYIYYLEHSQNHLYDLEPRYKNLLTRIWVRYFKARIDEMSNNGSQVVYKAKEYFLKSDWNEMFDLLEFIPNNYFEGENKSITNDINQSFFKHANDTLKHNLSAYRFVDGLLTEIVSEEEVSSIQQALTDSSPFVGVHTHLRRALELLTDRKKPDYRNSVKESISAIEALAKLISNNAKDSLGASLDKIKGKIKIHKALERGFKQIYGYTSDDSGIRHALTEESTCDFEDAKFMLVSCSAFINYLIVKAEKAGIEM